MATGAQLSPEDVVVLAAAVALIPAGLCPRRQPQVGAAHESVRIAPDQLDIALRVGRGQLLSNPDQLLDQFSDIHMRVHPRSLVAAWSDASPPEPAAQIRIETYTEGTDFLALCNDLGVTVPA